MEVKEKGAKRKPLLLLWAMFLWLGLFMIPLPIYADDSLSYTQSGRLTLRGGYALNQDSIKEDPSLIGRINIDARKSGWRLYSSLEGGWDGTIREPQRDKALFKNFEEVYQDNTPYLEFKEFFLERSLQNIDFRAGIQRFSWGRLDEYPVNDLFNPQDYTRFLLRPFEERKIGVPSFSANMSLTDWTGQLVLVPWLVPYRLPKPNERWSGISAGTALSQIPNAELLPQEPDLPEKKFENGSFGIRFQRMGEIEWAINLFHGFDPRPIFKTTALRITPSEGKLLIDPGVVPSFNKITSIGLDAATVIGDWSVRAEAALALNRHFNVRQELWGYPDNPRPGANPLNPIEVERNSLDYGFAFDYRLFEDVLLTMQVQQTKIFDRPDTLFQKEFETLLWANLKMGWLNQKLETSLNFAYNPEQEASMAKVSAYYRFSDSWKAGLIALFLDGPPQSIFGRYDLNDQISMELVYSW